MFYKRTSIVLPSSQAIYIKGNNIDTLSNELIPYETLLPKPITQNIYENIESHLNKSTNNLSYLNKKVYAVSTDMNLFVVTAISENAKTGLNYIGIYRNGNYDYFTSVYEDSIGLEIDSKLIKFEEIKNEYLVTSVIEVQNAKRYERLSFKDTSEQLLWYKLEM